MAQPAQLLVYVDDATSWLMQLLFASSESLSPILKPAGDGQTHFGRAMAVR